MGSMSAQYYVVMFTVIWAASHWVNMALEAEQIH